MRVTLRLPHALGMWLVGNQKLYTLQINHFVACNDSIMATEQLGEKCFADSQRLRALGIALGYKSRAFWLYQDHPLDYLFVMSCPTNCKCSLVS